MKPNQGAWFGIVTLFPEMFKALDTGVVSRAISKQLLTLQYWNPRDYAEDKRRTVDDAPYGGGPGMLLMTPPLRQAIQAAKQTAPSPPFVVYLSPQGRPFNQELANQYAVAEKSILLIAGRYEGVDERLIDQEVDEEWSIGDYILTGGELAAMVIIDALTRLIPGVLGDQKSADEDSFMQGLLKYPQYTKPEQDNYTQIPGVLLSGHHREIAAWRLKQALGRTWLKRPDLLANRTLNEEEKQLLAEFIEEFCKSHSIG